MEAMVGHSVPQEGTSTTTAALVVSSEDISLWNVADKTCIQRLESYHTYVVGILTTLTNGLRLASGFNDGTVGLWKRKTKKRVWLSGAPTMAVIIVSWSYKYECSLEGHEKDVLCVRELRSNPQTSRRRKKDENNGDESDGDDGHGDYGGVGGEELIVSSSVDGTIRVWDIVRRECLHVLRLPMDTVESSSIRVSPLDGYIVSSADDGAIRVWNGETGQCLCTKEVGLASWVLLFLRDGSLLWGGGDHIDILVSDTWITFGFLRSTKLTERCCRLISELVKSRDHLLNQLKQEIPEDLYDKIQVLSESHQ
eukprot:TRINITY_DN6597_c0_g1_i4.p1 TRINITY_DN6597_c0_g1~~TRINITY_DN6597_c0_g1_i4.p1  ORF type:complete len:310 (-),score=45.73 TRINITY_DN6597_c0_g1_i4:224-1153(-)